MIEGGPFLVEERKWCHRCFQPIAKGDPALFGVWGLEHAVHALGGFLPDEIPTIEEWLAGARCAS